MKQRFKQFVKKLNEEVSVEIRLDLQSAAAVAEQLEFDISTVGAEQLAKGISVEFEEHPDVHKGDVLIAGRIAIAHLKDLSNYYDLLEKMEENGEKKKQQ